MLAELRDFHGCDQCLAALGKREFYHAPPARRGPFSAPAKGLRAGPRPQAGSRYSTTSWAERTPAYSFTPRR